MGKRAELSLSVPCHPLTCKSGLQANYNPHHSNRLLELIAVDWLVQSIDSIRHKSTSIPNACPVHLQMLMMSFNSNKFIVHTVDLNNFLHTSRLNSD